MRFKDISRLFQENLYFLRQPTTLRPKNLGYFLIKDFFKKSRLFSSAWPQRSAQNFIFIPEAILHNRFFKSKKIFRFQVLSQRHFPRWQLPKCSIFQIQVRPSEAPQAAMGRGGGDRRVVKFQPSTLGARKRAEIFFVCTPLRLMCTHLTNRY